MNVVGIISPEVNGSEVLLSMVSDADPVPGFALSLVTWELVALGMLVTDGSNKVLLIAIDVENEEAVDVVMLKSVVLGYTVVAAVVPLATCEDCDPVPSATEEDGSSAADVDTSPLGEDDAPTMLVPLEAGGVVDGLGTFEAPEEEFEVLIVLKAKVLPEPPEPLARTDE